MVRIVTHWHVSVGQRYRSVTAALNRALHLWRKKQVCSGLGRMVWPWDFKVSCNQSCCFFPAKTRQGVASRFAATGHVLLSPATCVKKLQSYCNVMFPIPYIANSRSRVLGLEHTHEHSHNQR